MNFSYTGLCPCPSYFFDLTQKSNQKKSRLRLLRSKNQRLPAKIYKLVSLAARLRQYRFFYAVCSCFSAHQTRPVAVLLPPTPKGELVTRVWKYVGKDPLLIPDCRCPRFWWPMRFLDLDIKKGTRCVTHAFLVSFVEHCKCSW